LGGKAISFLKQEIASGEKHTCPGGRCQGERPRNDILSLLNDGDFIIETQGHPSNSKDEVNLGGYDSRNTPTAS
jgi:hypothetical protein